jgi:hypothetical protein
MRAAFIYIYIYSIQNKSIKIKTQILDLIRARHEKYWIGSDIQCFLIQVLLGMVLLPITFAKDSPRPMEA